MNNLIKRVWNRRGMTHIEDLQGFAFSNESGGHTFQISGVEDGTMVVLSGTVAASFLRPDQATVAITGSISGGVVSVTLPENCYDVPGRFGLVIFLTSDSQKTAIYSCVGNVARSSTSQVAPGTTADVVDLINQIQAAVATIPQSWTGLMADIAPTYSASAVYPVGAYVYYNGDLYRCTTAITTAESWTAGHWTAAVLGNDVAELKSAISDSQGNIIPSVELKNALNSFEDQIANGDDPYTVIVSPPLTANAGINSGTGALVTGLSNAFAVTEYIALHHAIKIDNEFYGYGDYGFAFYDSGRVYISGGKNVLSITDIPSNAEYIRFTDYVQSGNHTTKNITITSNSVVVGGIKNLIDDATADVILPTVISNNLINPADVQTGGYYLNNTGAWIANTSFNSSGLIPCQSGDTFIVFSAQGGPTVQVTYWGADRTTYISGVAVAEGTATTANSFTVPNNSNIKYLRISIIATRTEYRLNKSATPKPYDRYAEGYVFPKDVIAPNIQEIGQAAHKYAHFSFDDCIFWDDLTQNAATYDSAFDNSFLATLKNLHDTYGLKFTLFCFIVNGTASIANVTNKFAAEFSSNKDWLRFGFHGTTVSESFATADPETVLGYYNTFVTAIYRMTGDYDCIDRVTRLSSFGGSKAVCLALRNANMGLRGLLCNDGTGGSYFLNGDTNNYVNTSCKYYDAETQLTFIHSMSRLEGSGITVENLQTIAQQNHLPIFEFFSHQDQFTSGVISKTQQIADWLNSNGFTHGFSQYALVL